MGQNIEKKFLEHLEANNQTSTDSLDIVPLLLVLQDYL
jgi:hypothetical protein